MQIEMLPCLERYCQLRSMDKVTPALNSGGISCMNVCSNERANVVKRKKKDMHVMDTMRTT